MNVQSSILSSRQRRSSRARRRGYTLIELTVSVSSASFLVAGLASALLISLRALRTDTTASAENNRASQALAQLVDDLQHATRFTERTATAVTFQTPDRNGDSLPETIRYSWTGATGGSLMYQYNSDAAVAIATNVKSFNLSALNRVIPSTTLPISTYNVAFEAFTEAKAATDLQTLTITGPSGNDDYKLLIACIATDGNVANTFVTPSGWTLLVAQSNGDSSLNVWYKVGWNEPASYTFNWTGAERAYGWIMRFGNMNPAGPVNASATATGTALFPSCPTVTSTVDNCMILRIGAFDASNIIVDSPGMLSHTAITMDRSDTSSGAAAGGAAYANLATAGDSGTAAFTLTFPQEFVTCTIAIAPMPPQ